MITLQEYQKELLKPPFSICQIGGGPLLICDDRGDRALFKTYQNAGLDERMLAITKFARDSLNEKYERDFAEPKRLIKVPINIGCKTRTYECPKCKDRHTAYENTDYNFCPNCGVKL